MRRFNPEKELYKIQHGNRNKVIFSIITLLIILSISSSYALYQVRYSKRIIYTKVAPFSSNDELDLVIYVDGKKEEKIPSQGTAYVDNIECENTNNLQMGWNYTEWIMEIPKIEIPNKCKISFSKDMTNINFRKYLSFNKAIKLVNDKTKDQNLRYIGPTPSNYIWFNCNTYDGLTQETAVNNCEKWRIIGIMNNMTIVDENNGKEIDNQALIKIMKADSTNSPAYNTKDINNWETASLNISLKNYYNGTNFGGKGITEETRSMIENVKWYLGGVSAESTDSNYYTTATAQDFYTYERGENVFEGNPKTWNGHIGLLYPSDYGYASDTYNASITREVCLSTPLPEYSNICYASNWINISGRIWQETITPASSNITSRILIGPYGGLGLWTASDNGSTIVKPVLYLKSDINVSLETGDGTSSSPYRISS